MFAVAGLLVWYQLLDPARRGKLSRAGRLGMLVAMFVAGQALASVLLFANSPLYPAYSFQNDLLPGLTPLTDQRLAGAVMMAEQVIALGTLGALLLLAAERETRTVSSAEV
jgi:cytochrome c oxidase assembly factor CtaG